MADATGRPLLIVTGSSGLIGTRVLQQLGADYDAVGLDVNPPQEAHVPYRHVHADLTDDTSVERALASVRAEHGDRVASVLHLAAYYDFSGEPSPLYETLTVQGTARLLKGLRAFARVEQIAFSSTLLAMRPADDAQGPLTEGAPLQGEWDYPRSKIEAERVLRAECGDIPVVILRLAGAYDEDGHSPPLVQHIVRIHEKRLESYLFPGDATHGQPFVHLDDVVQCFAAAIARRQQLGPFETFLIAEPELLSYADLQERLGELIHGSAWPTIRVPKPVAKLGAWLKDKLPGPAPFIKPWMIDLADDHYPTEIGRARARLGWEPAHRLGMVLPEMVARFRSDPVGWYRRNGLEPPARVERQARSA